MKTILMTVLLACALFAGACSRSDKQPETTAQKTPNPPDPKVVAEAERIKQAEARSAASRMRITSVRESSTPSVPQSESPTPSPALP